MSKQWGHGYHTGNKEGLNVGVDVGAQIGAMQGAENAWHCVNAAIAAIRKGNEMQAIGVLEALLYLLASATGRDQPHPTKPIDDD